jgi:hypothetical protein
MAEQGPVGSQQPAASSRAVEAAELVRRLCIANSNAGVYAVDHPVAKGSIKSAYEYLRDIIERKEYEVVFNTAGDKILIGQAAVETRNPLIAQFTARLASLRLDNLHFKPGLTESELGAFFRVLAMKKDDVERAGGIRVVIEKNGISHITMSGATYVVLAEDQKIVSRDAKVSQDAPSPRAEANAEMVRTTIGEALKNPDDAERLLTMIRNDPKQAAAAIGRSLEQALAESERNVGGRDTIRPLVQNVKYVMQRLLEAGASPDPAAAKGGEKQADGGDVIVTFEVEL